VGRALSKELSMPFIDSDSEIEKVAGKTISEIFVDDGEQVFRKMEVEIVSKLLTDFTGVIALGGGAPITLETQQKLDSSDFPIIFIDVSISQAANRVGFNKDRPLLLINPRQQWLNLMNDRRPIYERLASEIVSSDNKKPVEVAKIISEKLKSKL
jgi:shikimate kinase